MSSRNKLPNVKMLSAGLTAVDNHASQFPCRVGVVIAAIRSGPCICLDTSTALVIDV